MILYHYTSRHHIPRIQINGLRKGVIPWNMDARGKPGFVAGWQWMTLNGDFNQAWALPQPFSKLPFRRDEYRITVKIPQAALERVVPWPVMAAKYHPDSEEFINSFADHIHWRLVSGIIPPAWFVEVIQNPHPQVPLKPQEN